MVKTYVINKILYGLQNVKITEKTLREADRMINYHVKNFLHPNVHIPNPALYAKIRDVGLGITELRHSIPKILHDRMCRL